MLGQLPATWIPACGDGWRCWWRYWCCIFLAMSFTLKVEVWWRNIWGGILIFEGPEFYSFSFISLIQFSPLFSCIWLKIYVGSTMEVKDEGALLKSVMLAMPINWIYDIIVWSMLVSYSLLRHATSSLFYICLCGCGELHPSMLLGLGVSVGY